jgi:hypothetical protein
MGMTTKGYDMRITRKHLEAKVSIVNGMLGFDEEDGYNTKGLLVLYGAYGGHQVHQYIGEAGAVNSLSTLGTARETAEFLSGMIAALRIVKNEV